MCLSIVVVGSKLRSLQETKLQKKDEQDFTHLLLLSISYTVVKVLPCSLPI
jgi:hypothetical protein